MPKLRREAIPAAFPGFRLRCVEPAGPQAKFGFQTKRVAGVWAGTMAQRGRKRRGLCEPGCESGSSRLGESAKLQRPGLWGVWGGGGRTPTQRPPGLGRLEGDSARRFRCHEAPAGAQPEPGAGGRRVHAGCVRRGHTATSVTSSSPALLGRGAGGGGKRSRSRRAQRGGPEGERGAKSPLRAPLDERRARVGIGANW